MYGRMSLATLGYECMKNHYSTNSYRECCSEKMPLSRSRSGSLSSKLDALTQLSAPLLLRPLPPETAKYRKDILKRSALLGTLCACISPLNHPASINCASSCARSVRSSGADSSSAAIPPWHGSDIQVVLAGNSGSATH